MFGVRVRVGMVVVCCCLRNLASLHTCNLCLDLSLSNEQLLHRTDAACVCLVNFGDRFFCVF
ncbi:hypothetical protein KC19_2G203100 [Ceratodon purpureus]|uniref:Secreted protein n=1 Tax=Ceratodon purpureus TaxID=3225 RepID=A0A8T0IW49_CERPU|nr:hypothetical protein KC19_2G203100 [Ceratodon purpureus]